jgi:hypothetical protein
MAAEDTCCKSSPTFSASHVMYSPMRKQCFGSKWLKNAYRSLDVNLFHKHLLSFITIILEPLKTGMLFSNSKSRRVEVASGVFVRSSGPADAYAGLLKFNNYGRIFVY